MRDPPQGKLFRSWSVALPGKIFVIEREKGRETVEGLVQERVSAKSQGLAQPAWARRGGRFCNAATLFSVVLSVAPPYVIILGFVLHDHFCPIPGDIVNECTHYRCQTVLCLPLFLGFQFETLPMA